MSQTLLSLHIQDFAIINGLEIDFRPGFTVLSGETGAGKSILFDALGLVLGDRADSSMVRAGATRAEIQASFDLQALPGVQRWLDEQGLSDPDDAAHLMVRRQIRANGQSRAYINGIPSTLGLLRSLAEDLVDIHGQHAHQSLLKPGEQRRLLDAYGGLEQDVAATTALYKELKAIDSQLQALSDHGQDASQRLDLLQYQLQELDELQPGDEEFEQLQTDFRRLSSADSLLRQAAQVSEVLYSGQTSAYDQVQTAKSALQAAIASDPRFASALEICEQAQISLKEAAQASEALAADIEPDPELLQQLSQRLDAYQSLARKHRVTPDQLAAHWQSLRQELHQLQDAQHSQSALIERREELQQRYASQSEQLSKQRQKAALDLAQAMTATVRPLGLPHAAFQIEVDFRAGAPAQAHGQDNVEFLICMNPGQHPAPLAKVASGGELARTSLAIQVVCLDQSPVPVLLFDEVDVGIGGGVAEVVGRRLKELARRYQVFCVTHQPQVAALADTHFGVSKSVDKAQTRTQVTQLTETARIEELARMLGGLRITEQTRSHAEEMLNLGQAPLN